MLHDKAVTGAPYSTESNNLSHSWTLHGEEYDWNSCSLQVAAEIAQSEQMAGEHSTYI